MSRQAVTSSAIVAAWNSADAATIAVSCQISPAASAIAQTPPT